MTGIFRCELCGKKYAYEKALFTHTDKVHPKLAESPKKEKAIKPSAKDVRILTNTPISLYLKYPISINGVEYVGRVSVSPELGSTLQSLHAAKEAAELKIHQFFDHRPKNDELANVGY